MTPQITPAAPLLQARGLTKNFTVGKTMMPGSGKVLHAVDAIDLEVRPGETLGLVGESGSGKSTLGRCLTRLYDITAGELTFDGQEIGRADTQALKPVRRKMQMIFQDPSASLNPKRRVRDMLAERGILYAPDYVINAGGIIAVTYEYLARREGRPLDLATTHAAIDAIPGRLSEIWERARAEGTAPSRVADAMAQRLIGRN